MKKLALLLGALSLVSSVAYAKEVVPAVEEVVVVEEAAPVAAAPALTVTYFGQGLEVDNTSGSNSEGNVGTTHFSNSVGLAYDDWTFDLMARKSWDIDTDEGTHSTGAFRIDLDAWKKVNDNLSVGARWRQEKSMDRYYLRTKYNYGMFSGNIDVAYQSNNGSRDGGAYDESGDFVKSDRARDGYYVEATPVAVTVGPVTLGYYFKTESNIATGSEPTTAGIDHWYRHQLRASMPIYQGEKLNVGVQYAWEFANDIEIDGQNSADTYTLKHDNNSHILWLNASYAVTENLTVSGYYEYDMFEWEKEGNGKTYVDNGGNATGSKDSDKYYGEFYIGWTYTF